MTESHGFAHTRSHQIPLPHPHREATRAQLPPKEASPGTGSPAQTPPVLCRGRAKDHIEATHSSQPRQRRAWGQAEMLCHLLQWAAPLSLPVTVTARKLQHLENATFLPTHGRTAVLRRVTDVSAQFYGAKGVFHGFCFSELQIHKYLSAVQAAPSSFSSNTCQRAGGNTEGNMLKQPKAKAAALLTLPAGTPVGLCVLGGLGTGVQSTLAYLLATGNSSLSSATSVEARCRHRYQ